MWLWLELLCGGVVVVSCGKALVFEASVMKNLSIF